MNQSTNNTKPTTDFTLFERGNADALQRCIDSGYITDLNDTIKLQLYHNRLKKRGKVKVEYQQSQYNGNYYGRWFPQTVDTSCARMWSAIRSDVFDKNTIDIDIKNCVPSIMSLILSQNNITCPMIDEYVADRASFFPSIGITERQVRLYNKRTRSNCTVKDLCKRVIISYIFGSGKRALDEELGFRVHLKGKALKLKEEIVEKTKDIISLPEFKTLVDDVRKQRQIEKKNIHNGCLLSIILFDQEAKYVRKAMDTFTSNGFEICSYVYDGFQVYLKSGADANVEKILKKVNQNNPSLVEFIIKPFPKRCTELSFEIGSEDYERVQKAKKYTQWFKMIDDTGGDCCEYSIATVVDSIIDECVYDGCSWWNYQNGYWSKTSKGSGRLSVLISTKAHEVFSKFRSMRPKPLGLGSREADLQAGVEKQMIFSKLTAKKGNIIKELQAIKLDEGFVDRLDAKIELLGFPDGVVNLVTGQRLPLDKSHYLTKCCNVTLKQIDAVTQADIDLFYDKVFNRIYPNPELREYMVDIFAKSLIGYNPKKFWTLSGTGDNGKGFLTRILAAALGAYLVEFDSSLLTKSLRSSGTGGTQSELVRLRGARMAFTREPGAGETLKTGTIKNFTGDGDKISGRELYSSVVTFALQSSLFMECNNKLPIDETNDKAVRNRVENIVYKSEFTDDMGKVDHQNNIYAKDHTLNTQKWRNEFAAPTCMAVLLERLSEMKESELNQYNPPQQVIDATNAWFEESNPFLFYLNETLVKTENDNDTIKFKDLMAMFRQSEDFKSLTKKKRRTLTRKYCMTEFQRSKYWTSFHEMLQGTRSVLVGYKRYDDEEEKKPST